MAASVDVSTFAAQVIERSRTRPVVVDFWADWCGPCHQLSPILERVAERYADDVDFVKLDVDAAPDLARRHRVQGIPSVKAFKDGAVVSEFTGVQPEQAVDRFFAALAPSEADRLVARAEGAEDPEPLLREALVAEPGHEGATLALAELTAEGGDRETALALLEKVPASDEVRRLRSRLRLAAPDAETVDLRAAAASGDPHARVRLGRVLAGQGDYEEALDVLLEAVADGETRDEAREALVEIFDLLGADHALVKASRPRLASALYA